MVPEKLTVARFYQSFGGALVFAVSLDFLLHSEEWGVEGLSLPIILLLLLGLTNMLYGLKAFAPEFRLKIHINWRVVNGSGNEYEEAIMRELMNGLGESSSFGKGDKPKRNT